MRAAVVSFVGLRGYQGPLASKPIEKTFPMPNAKPNRVPNGIAELRLILRRYPYWPEGHRLLAEACLKEGDIATAYASTHCFGALTTAATSAQQQLHFLMGRCYLRRGDAERALCHLSLAEKYNRNYTPIFEEQAAAHMLLGDGLRALQILERVPQNKLSAEALVTRSYLRNSTAESKQG
jgi:tetratricopeptide (TPR) repeat protein